MLCVNCQSALVACECPDIEERLSRLTKSRFVHVGDTIRARILAGKSVRSDFPADIDFPFSNPDEAHSTQSLADFIRDTKPPDGAGGS